MIVQAENEMDRNNQIGRGQAAAQQQPDFKMRCYTYLSRDFDYKEEDLIKSLNEEITTDHTVRLVFYEQISSGVLKPLNERSGVP